MSKNRAPKHHGEADQTVDREPIDYDFDAIYRHYEPLTNAEKHLSKTLARTRTLVHTLYYEELVSAPMKELTRALEYLLPEVTAQNYIASRSRAALESNRLVPTGRDINNLLAVRFADDLADRNLVAHEY